MSDRIVSVQVTVKTKDGSAVEYERYLDYLDEVTEPDVRNAILAAGSSMIYDAKECGLL